MSKKKEKVLATIFILFAIINIIFLVIDINNNVVDEFYTLNSIILTVMQIVAIIISIFVYKENENSKRGIILISIVVLIFIITYFIKIGMSYDFAKAGVGELVPTVMPKKIYFNLYNIPRRLV